MSDRLHSVDSDSMVLANLFQTMTLADLPQGVDGPSAGALVERPLQINRGSNPGYPIRFLFGESLDHLRSNTGKLIGSNIASCIVELDFTIRDLIPQDKQQALQNDEHDFEESDLTNWSNVLWNCLVQCFSFCQNIQVISFEGFTDGDRDLLRDEELEKLFLENLIYALREVQLPNLTGLHFSTRNLSHLEALWEPHHKSPVLTSNLTNIKDLSFQNPFESDEFQESEHIKQFLIWATAFDLRRFVFIPDLLMCHSLWIAPLQSKINLRSLELRKVDIKDSLSGILINMQLHSINLNEITLCIKSDQWLEVFRAIDNMSSLQTIDMGALRYELTELCHEDAFCSSSSADRGAYSDLRKKVSLLVQMGRMRSRKLSDICQCYEGI